MRLLAILIGLWAHQFTEHLDAYRGANRISNYIGWIRRRAVHLHVWDGPLGLALVVGLPTLVLALVQYGVAGWLLGLVDAALGVAVLLFCFGAGGLDERIASFLDAWEQNRLDEARSIAVELNAEPEDSTPASDLPWLLVRGLLVQSYERILGPVFWFAVLGPFGALLFRLSYALRDHVVVNEQDQPRLTRSALVWAHLVGWLPARAAALAFGLAGSFVDALRGWESVAGASRGANRVSLVGAGFGALGMEDRNAPRESVREFVHDARALVTRTLMIWAAVIAFLTLAGWLA